MINNNACLIKEVSEFERELSIMITKEDLKKETDKAYYDLSKKVNLKGFRSGKIPRSILEQHYKHDTTKEVLNKLMQEKFQKSILEQNIIPVSIPEIKTKTELTSNKDFIFTATFQVKPKIKVKQWKNLKFTSNKYKINDNSVEMELNDLQKKQGILINVEHRNIIKIGDFIQCEYLLLEDLNNHELNKDDLSKYEKKTIEIGSNLFFPEVEKKLIGKKINDFLLIDMDNKDIKKSKLSIKINAIKYMKLKEIDDEFAKNISKNFQTLENLKKAIKEKHEHFKIQEEDNSQKDSATDALIEANPFTAPPAMIDSQSEQMAINYISASSQEKAKEIFKKFGEQIKKNLRPKAEKIIKAALLCEEIAKNQKIIIDQESIDNELKKEADQMSMTIEKLKSNYDKTELENISLRLSANKAINLVIENADITFNEELLFN